MKYALMVVLLLAAPAAADPAVDNATCPYPQAALAANAHGNTLVGFLPMTDGTLRNATLRHSSGNSDLDQAAVACVTAWRFDPQDSKDRLWVEAKGAYIYWRLQGGPDNNPVGRRTGKPHNCDWAYPNKARAQGLTGTTAMQFVISTEGRVHDAQLVSSSGSSALDDAAFVCVRRWRYIPAVKDNQNVEAAWYAEIPWAPDDALVTVERAPDNPVSPRSP